MKYIMLILLLTSSQANAICTSHWMCDDNGGNCELEDLCENDYDFPSINVPPIEGVYLPQVRPLLTPMVPPIGADDCDYEMVDGEYQIVCE